VLVREHLVVWQVRVRRNVPFPSPGSGPGTRVKPVPRGMWRAGSPTPWTSGVKAVRSMVTIVISYLLSSPLLGESEPARHRRGRHGPGLGLGEL